MGRPSFGVDAAPEGAVTPGWEDVAVAVHQAFCFELDPNNEARSALASHVGAARFAFNTMLAYVRWALDARAFERRTTGVAVTEVPWTLPSLRKVWNHQVKEWAAPWWPQNSKEAYSCGLARLAAALDNFSQSRRGRRAGPAMGFPRFKTKTGRRSFRVTTGAFGVVDDRHIRLPRIGVIRVKEPTVALRDRIDDGSARVLSATVSERAGRWFVSFGCLVQRRDRPPVHPDHVAGVDLGVKSLAVVAAVGPTGAVKTKTVANPKPCPAGSAAFTACNGGCPDSSPAPGGGPPARRNWPTATAACPTCEPTPSAN
jgi:putative transposase